MLATLPARMSGAARAVLPAIAQAAERTGADFNALFKMARLESSFRSNAKAATSSATGLFQFIDSTWLRMLEKHGPANGIGPMSRADALQLRNDPTIASLMAAEHMADNAAMLEQALGRGVDDTDLYLAHFLGPAGARKFLHNLAQTPTLAGASLLPAAARANPAIFYSGGAPRSLAEIHQLLAARLNSGLGESLPRQLPAALNARIAAAPAAPAAPVNTFANDSAGMIHASGLPPGAGRTSIPPAVAARFAYLLLAELGG